MSYLVAFVADPARDEHVDGVRALARTVDGAGWFDGDPADPERTLGAFVRATELDAPAAGALLEAVVALSAALGVRFEVQLAEVVLGHVEAGVPDARLRAALSA